MEDIYNLSCNCLLINCTWDEIAFLIQLQLQFKALSDTSQLFHLELMQSKIDCNCSRYKLRKFQQEKRLIYNYRPQFIDYELLIVIQCNFSIFKSNSYPILFELLLSFRNSITFILCRFRVKGIKVIRLKYKTGFQMKIEGNYAFYLGR